MAAERHRETAVAVAGTALLERERELQAIDGALEAARAGSGRLVVLEGAAGIGKTRLLGAAADRATEAGMHAVVAAGRERERELAFGLARRLFEPALGDAHEEERRELLSGAAALAAPVISADEGGGPSVAAGDQAFPLIHGLYWLASNLADRTPLLLVADDAHWADSPSLRFLLYVAQRVDQLPLSIVVATRPPGEPGADRELLSQLLAHPLGEPQRVGPLGPDSIDRLVRAVRPEADEAFSRACADATGGNPFLLRELLEAVHDEGLPATADAATVVARLAPEAVSRALLARIARLPDRASAFVRAVAVLGEDARLRHAAALAGLDVGTASRAADALAAAEVLEPGEPLSFVHPLIRSGVYADLSSADRERAHGRAARLLDAEGGAAERVASHLLSGERTGDPWAVDTLTGAATGALERGAPASAATFLERALEEPPAARARAGVLVALGEAEAASGNAAGLDRLREAVDLFEAPEDRARTLLATGRSLYTQGQMEEAFEAYERGLSELGHERASLRDALARELRAGAVLASLFGPWGSHRLEEFTRSDVVDPTPGERAVLANVALQHTLMVQTGHREALDMAYRALGADYELLREETADGASVYSVSGVQIMSDDLGAELRLLDAAIDDARRRGSVLGFATASYCRAAPLWFMGRVSDAIADSEQALDAGSSGWDAYRTFCRGTLALMLLDAGRPEDAARVLEPEAGEDDGHSPGLVVIRYARARLDREEGRAEDALATLLEIGAGIPYRNVFGPVSWRSEAALAHAALGQWEEARRIAEEEVAMAREWGAPRILGLALRARGLAEPGDDAIEWLEQAVDVLESSESVLERARTLIDLGASVHRAGRDAEAREHLSRALDLLSGSGADGLIARATKELQAAGGRPRRQALSGVESLTPSERRVAQMAAEGMTNREVAQALFVTVKAVQWHLRNVYRKLGVGSREEVGKALDSEEPDGLEP